MGLILLRPYPHVIELKCVRPGRRAMKTSIKQVMGAIILLTLHNVQHFTLHTFNFPDCCVLQYGKHYSVKVPNLWVGMWIQEPTGNHILYT